MGLLYVVYARVESFFALQCTSKGAAFDARRDEEERYKTS